MIHAAELDVFIRCHYQRFWSYAYFLTRDRSDAEDIIQDALVRIAGKYWDDRLADRVEREQVRYILATVASEHKNLMRKRYGSAHPAALEIDVTVLDRLAPRGPDTDPAALVAELTGQECRQTYLSGLSSDQARVLWLRAVEGYSVREVATMLSMSEGNVKSTCSRAIEKARRSWSDESSHT